MHSITIIDKDEKGNIVNTRNISLELKVSEHEIGYKYEILSNWNDTVCIQEFDPTLWGYEPMSKEDATKYGNIIMARMLTTNPDIYEAICGWGDDSLIVASAVLKKTYKE